jgi:hypothetical protein
VADLGAAAMLPLLAVVGGATVHRLGVQATVRMGFVIATVGPAGLALARTTHVSGQTVASTAAADSVTGRFTQLGENADLVPFLARDRPPT